MDELGIAEGPSAALRQELDKLAKGARHPGLNGHGDRIFGHVALRDPEGRGFWLKRHHISLGELFDRRDFILCRFRRQAALWPGPFATANGRSMPRSSARGPTSTPAPTPIPSIR